MHLRPLTAPLRSVTSALPAPLDLLGRLLQRRTGVKRASRSGAFTGKRIPKHRGLRKGQGECVKPGTILVRQVGKVFYPGPHVTRSHDYSLVAEQEGFVRYYWDKKYPNSNQVSLARKMVKRYCGLVFHPEDQLPRDEATLGRARRFPKIERGALSDYLKDRGSRNPSIQTEPFSDMPPPPDARGVLFTTEDARRLDEERQPGPMTERELEIASMRLTGRIAADSLPKSNNVRRTLGLPLKKQHKTPLDRAARLAEIESGVPREFKRAEADLMGVVSSEDLAQVREASRGTPKKQLPPETMAKLSSLFGKKAFDPTAAHHKAVAQARR